MPSTLQGLASPGSTASSSSGVIDSGLSGIWNLLTGGLREFRAGQLLERLLLQQTSEHHIFFGFCRPSNTLVRLHELAPRRTAVRPEIAAGAAASAGAVVLPVGLWPLGGLWRLGGLGSGVSAGLGNAAALGPLSVPPSLELRSRSTAAAHGFGIGRHSAHRALRPDCPACPGMPLAGVPEQRSPARAPPRIDNGYPARPLIPHSPMVG